MWKGELVLSGSMDTMVNIWNGKSVWMLMCGEAQVDLLH